MIGVNSVTRDARLNVKSVANDGAQAIIRVAAPAKINLRLRVVGVRSDGYHLLDSVVVPVRLFDQLVIEVRRARETRVAIHCTGDSPEVPTDQSNLAVRAARMYADRCGLPLDIQLQLTKRIPVGAGLGGGSSDAAAVLRGLNSIADRPVEAARLARWALELGADVPFFLFGRPAQMTGIGEELSPFQLPSAAQGPLVLVFPGMGLATKEVYGRYDGSLTSESVASSICALTPGQAPLQDWLSNDLEAAAFQVLPKLGKLKRHLRALGARAVVMTGSGSAMFGFWSQRECAEAAARQLRADGMWAHGTEVLEQLPVVERDEQQVGGRQVG